MAKKIIKTKTEIKKAVIELAEAINSDYRDKEIDLICLNDSADYLASDLIKLLKVKTRICKLKFTNYKKPTNSGEVKILEDLKYSIYMRDVIMVDGIIISGITHNYLSRILKQRKPNSIALVSVGKKPKLLKIKMPKCYSLFSFNDEWVEGYGFGSEKNKNKNYLVDTR